MIQPDAGGMHEIGFACSEQRVSKTMPRQAFLAPSLQTRRFTGIARRRRRWGGGETWACGTVGPVPTDCSFCVLKPRFRRQGGARGADDFFGLNVDKVFCLCQIPPMRFSGLYVIINRSLSAALVASSLGCGVSNGMDVSAHLQPAKDGGASEAGVETEALPASPKGSSPTIIMDIDAGPSPDAGPAVGKTVLYAHTDTRLYEVDPDDPELALTEVGEFDCLDEESGEAITDLAIDKHQKLIGASQKSIFLDMQTDASSKTVHCRDGKVALQVAGNGTSSRFYGLTYAPPTPNLGADETLIGANSNGELYKIDTKTGELTLVGIFGKVPKDDGRGHKYANANVGKTWELSGDIVFLSNGGSPIGFATVRDCPNPPDSKACSRVDTLVEIDVQKLRPSTSGNAPVVTKAIRGQVLPARCKEESCGFDAIYGIAALNDKVYGFARSGAILRINNSTGEALLVNQALTTPPSSNGFAGAGVTTLAPVVPPPPR